MPTNSEFLIKRSYFPDNFNITDWNSIAPYFQELAEAKLTNFSDVEEWLYKRSELDAICAEDLAWRYIHANCDTENIEFEKHFEYFINSIQPELIRYHNILDKKILSTDSLHSVDLEGFKIYLRSVKSSIELFRDENITLISEAQLLEQEYGKISAAQTITYNNAELTLHAASNLLKETDRNIREKVFYLMNERRQQDVDALNELLNKLIVNRQLIAKNCGFKNYRDYKHIELGRFDYTIQDTLDFHEAIEKEVCPIAEEFIKLRKQALQLSPLKPWDLEVDIENKPPLVVFKSTDELVTKSIAVFNSIKPTFGNYIKLMQEKNHLDLASRKGKAPGGFNYPMAESSIPFIFMNATNNLRDLETFMHEGGHAIHNFLSFKLPLSQFKDTPAEIAEVASMAMELISMEHWHLFFNNNEELKRAKLSQLQSVITVLPWVATIDCFQHWIYTNESHTIEERSNAWNIIKKRFSSNIIDWTGQELYFQNTWQRQLHIFEVPFYYIEYGIAQLGAIALWKNYKNNPAKTIEQYTNALSYGYTKTLPELYSIAGIEFNFSRKYIKGLMDFVLGEIHQINKLS